MPKQKIIKLFSRLTGTFTASELQQREIGYEDSSQSLVVKRPNNALIRFASGVPNITPQAYQASPTLTTLRDALVSAGVMLPQPVFIVSGTITGAVVNNVGLALVGSSTYNATSDVSGIFTFPSVPDGSYTLTPTSAGYFFTPSNRNVVVSGADVTSQNFTSAVSASSQNTSVNFVLVPTSSNSVRAVQKSPRTLNGNTFAGVTSRIYVPTFQGTRWFMGINTGNVLVYDETWTLKATIASATHGAGIVFKIHYYSGKYCFVGSSGIRFGTYNETTDIWTNGTFLANEVYPLDSSLQIQTGKIFIASGLGGAPSRNTTVVSMVSETVIDRRQVGGSVNLKYICAGINGLIGVTDGQSYQVVNNSWGNVGSFTSVVNQNGAVAYSQGAFWMTQTTNGTLRAVSESTGNTVFTPSGYNAPFGCISDDNFIYVGEQGANQLAVIDATTGNASGSAVTGITGANYITA